MKTIPTIILSVTGLMITALVTTAPGQIMLAVITTWFYKLFAGESIWTTLWNNPTAILEFIF